MFNLIPHTLKERILRDYKERRIIVILYGCLFLIFTLVVFISPTFGTLFFEEKNIFAEAEVLKNSEQFKKSDQVVNTIKETNEHLRALSLEVGSVDPISAVEKMIQVKNSFIHVTDIQYKETSASSSTLVIEGIADKRDSLRQFVTNLQATPGFSDVVLPVSNFAKDKDIDFSISIKII